MSDVGLRGAIERARLSGPETEVPRRATDTATTPANGRAVAALDLFALLALGEHVLRRELQLFRRPALFSLIVRDSLNPGQLDISKFTKAQLVAFIVTRSKSIWHVAPRPPRGRRRRAGRRARA